MGGLMCSMLQASLNSIVNVIGCMEILTYLLKMHLLKGFSQQRYALPEGHVVYCVGYSTWVYSDSSKLPE